MLAGFCSQPLYTASLDEDYVLPAVSIVVVSLPARPWMAGLVSTGRREQNPDPTKEQTKTSQILEAPEACSHRIREQALQRVLEPLFLC